MSERDGPVATLAALFAPASAVALLGRLAAPGGAVAEATRLAAASRRERLQALGAAVSPHPHASHARAQEAARLERPRVAEVIRRLGAGTPEGAASRVLLRLCRERIAR